MIATTMNANTARELMTDNPVSITEKTTLREAAAFLTRRSISAAPVINDAGRPVGVLSRTDLIRFSMNPSDALRMPREFADEANTPSGQAHSNSVGVRQVMTPVVLSVGLDASPAEVCEKMLDHKVHRVFVTDQAGILVGVISALDVLRCMTR